HVFSIINLPSREFRSRGSPALILNQYAFRQRNLRFRDRPKSASSFVPCFVTSTKCPHFSIQAFIFNRNAFLCRQSIGSISPTHQVEITNTFKGKLPTTLSFQGSKGIGNSR